jgi:hypothetical protein
MRQYRQDDVYEKTPAEKNRILANMNGLVLTELLKDQTTNQRRIDGPFMGEWLCSDRLVSEDLWMDGNKDIARV